MSRAIPLLCRILLLMAGFVSLAFGTGTGLLRLGWSFPLPSAGLAAFHGPLMVCGFLGTVIALERAVAIGRHWAYLGPFFAAVGGLTLVAGANWFFGAGLMTLASAILLSASTNVFLRQRALFTLTLLLGSLCWLIGNLLWMGGLTMAQVAPWWAGFLLLTIAGERLELSRLLRLTRFASTIFAIIVTLFLLGASMASLTHPSGITVISASMLALALWLLRQDIARKTVHQQGLTRFIAVCLLSGYAWLLAAALIGLWSPQLMAGSNYDAFLHAIFVGFVFSMIFGHAPIIFPAIARVSIPYHPTFYLPLIVLHGSLIARVAGDLLLIPHCRSAGGGLNALALALFILSTVAAVIRGKRRAIST